jgi:LysM repeat protein
MKLLKFGAVVLGLHIIGFILVFVYPGCRSTPRGDTSGNQAATRLMQDEGNIPPAPPPPPMNLLEPSPAAPALASPASGIRVPPTRPTAEQLGEDFTPAPTAPSGRAFTDYTVVRGDTLVAISRKSGVQIDEILSANNLNRNSILRVGQVLRIPVAGSAAPTATVTAPAAPVAPATSSSYTVVAGDSLYTIARRHGTTVDALRRANRLTSDRLQIGQVLTIPGSSGATPSSAAVAQAAARPAPAPVLSAPPAGGITHTVAPGETLGAIARRYNVSAAEIMRANNVSDPRLLRAGATLTIPGRAAAPAATPPAPKPAPAPTPAPAPVLPPAPRLPADPGPGPGNNRLPSDDVAFPVPVIPSEEVP